MKLKSALLISLAAVAILSVSLHLKWVNGSWYWVWPWRNLSPAESARWFAWMAAASLPLVAGVLTGTLARHRAGAIGLLMLGVFAIKLMSLSVLTKPLSLDVLRAVVRDPVATSYYSDAAALADQDDWLILYPQLLPQTQLHTQSKPPGAVAFFRFLIRRFGYGERSATIGGVLLAALATLSIPATYWMTRVLLDDRLVASSAATLLALCPGFVIIFPTFDAVWVALACALVATWHLAVARDDWRFAAAFGAILTLACFGTYNLLALGAFLAAITFASNGIKAIFRAVAVALATMIAASLVLWLLTGFDPIGTFQSAWQNQQALLAAHRADRPYPWTILFDLLDFALGAGWLPVVLASAGLVSAPRRHRRLVIACIGLPVLVALLGLLQSETARVWNFMLPLLLIPAAIELARWPIRARLATYFAMLAVMLTVGRHMRFMSP